ncbi:MAG: hypothetical protein KDD44_13230, partial [Bdellovibrionales bacterium]|nr:hypothetical protein [Bdellovibrionales bacterium]
MQSRLFASLRSFLRAQSTGHATLAALFSVSGGILFSMAMIDFAKVVIASNAVETATAAVTRCLSTTDGECKTQSLSEPKLNLAWYGYNPEQQVVEYADRYNYRASMRRENWQASFPTYYLNRLSPEVQWQEYEVPVHTVSAEMNRFEQRYATRRMIGNQPLESFRAAFSRFGTFDGSREEVLRYGAGWSYSGNPANGDGTALHSVSDSIRIAANTTHTFRSGWSAVPALTATASSTRQRMNGSAWAGKIVNHGGNQDDWWRDAYLAIKLTGSFLRVPGQGNADLRWENIVVESCEQI